MSERERGTAGFARLAGRSVGEPRLAEERPGEEKGGACFPDPGGAVEQIRVPDVSGLQRGTEKRYRFILAAESPSDHI